MVETVLCYLERDDHFLLLLRNKRKNDINHGKWIGVGGHIEKGETPEEAIKREVKEETNLDLLNYQKRGVILFKNEDKIEKMHVYSSKDFAGELSDCDEGELKWIKKEEIVNLSLWEGDRIFLPLLINGDPFFSFELNYCQDRLVSYKIKNDF
ncbi:MAG TPA: 8-oxo-dGTP diphosphatase [Bacilli bacterium]|nr:8-oxo-dGTP diphosphatase [Bacilli bacterium]